ncbi:hypothetical protein GGTG_07534 [Gaeumannomyces tritici R3-111a-1]|uniref:Secreted protein n=1 Tax=Gaeumannomyces tritici (strain R3-111a-1) TaxID=644352 RepID=J3P1Y6_GAET3|nr:hypothetical protein GGTG_07534 [Gaeumannomyces tritici R3-111a-1]EJT73678.1 hypothetical protein GGTG_07534 [Gaeumannomyces tritici R3-111a-1]
MHTASVIPLLVLRPLGLVCHASPHVRPPGAKSTAKQPRCDTYKLGVSQVRLANDVLLFYSLGRNGQATEDVQGCQHPCSSLQSMLTGKHGLKLCHSRMCIRGIK